MFIKNPGTYATYHAGEVISFRLKGQPEKHTELIRDIEDSTLVFQYYKVKVSEISDMYHDKKTKFWWFMKYKYGGLLIITGSGYLLLDWINSGEIKKETAIFSAAAIGAGFLVRALIPKRIPIKGKRKLVVIHV